MANIDKKELDEINELYEQRKREHHRINASKKAIVNVVVCGVFFFGTVIYLLLFERPTISEVEKRALATFPQFSWESYFSGDYTAGITKYYDDTVPNRDNFKALGAQFQKLFGLTLDQGSIQGNVKPVETIDGAETSITTTTTEPILIVTPAPSAEQTTPTETNDEVAVTTPTAETEETPVETTTEKPAETTAEQTTTTAETTQFTRPEGADAEIIYNENAQMVYRNDGELYGISLYKGEKSYADSLADSINKFASSLDGVDVYAMAAPTQNTFLLPKSLSDYSNDELSHIKYLNKLFSDNVTVIDAYSILKNHADKEIYFKTDLHWTQLGAYYVAQQFAKKAEVPFAKAGTYDKKETECYGSMYLNTKLDELYDNPETFTYYKPTNDYSTEYYDSSFKYLFDYPMMPETDYRSDSFYSLYMVSDSYIKKISTDADNDRTLVVFKDSYPSSMIPWLTSSFKTIYVVDIRYCELNGIDFCNEVGATDVFFGMSSYTAFGDDGAKIEDIRTY